MTPRSALALLFAAILLLTACERTPDDLEQWRNAEGGTEKMVEWASSQEEPMPVRKRAVQILVEQDRLDELQRALSRIHERDPETAAALSAAATESIKELWAAQDIPTIDADEAKNGRVKIAPSKSVQAKDAAYYVHPYASASDQKELEAILSAWMATDQIVRDQMGDTTLGQILPRAGAKGFDGILTFFAASPNPEVIARDIVKDADDETMGRFAEVVAERLEKEHPQIDASMLAVAQSVKHEALIPYFKRVIEDPKSPPALADVALQQYVDIQGPKATGFLNELIAKNPGPMRWVAIDRLIELRGPAGVSQAANSLPLEIEGWPSSGKHTIERESTFFCNAAATELTEQEKKDAVKPTLSKLLDSPRWPARVIGARCAEVHKWPDLKPKIAALSGDKQLVPGWGEGQTSLGQVADQIAAEL